MKILLPVDGSAYTKRMFAWLTTNQEWLSGAHQFTVLTVTPAIPPHAASVFSAEDIKAYYDDCAEAVFKPIRKFLAKHDLATRYEAKVGHAPEVIAKLADKGKFDLVVMGSHGHGNLMNLVMGSVTTQVMARTKVPMLLIR